MNDYPPQVVRLANEIADTLNDRGSLQLFLHFAEKYKEEHLTKIKKTRGALFTYLVSQYENDNSRG